MKDESMEGFRRKMDKQFFIMIAITSIIISVFLTLTVKKYYDFSQRYDVEYQESKTAPTDNDKNIICVNGILYYSLPRGLVPILTTTDLKLQRCN